jgi:hypothetical protein
MLASKGAKITISSDHTVHSVVCLPASGGNYNNLENFTLHWYSSGDKVTRTTRLYDRRNAALSLDEIERILI